MSYRKSKRNNPKCWSVKKGEAKVPAPKPDGYALVATRNRGSFAEAESACEEMGMTLATISSKKEEDYARDVCKKDGDFRSEGCYIGLYRTTQKGDWQWVSGK